MDSVDILSRFSVYPEMEQPRFFQLGCTATLLNVHAQQMRAFNLVWALTDAGMVSKGSLVAIIGAGIAGVTAAVGLAAVGAKITLYETSGEFFHLQRGNLTRFLHPNIATWPNDGFGYPVTHLPYMNWRAGAAGDVEAQLRSQLRRFCENCKLTIERDGDSPIKVESVEQTSMNEVVIISKGVRVPFDVVIAAVGFGIERPRLSTTPSYWRNDDLAQPIIGATTPPVFLVSGSGDGGLIEVLRLTIDDFQHQRFMQKVMFDERFLELGKLYDKLVRTCSPGQENNIWDEFTTLSKLLPEHEQSGIDELFNPFIRSDRSVILNTRAQCAFLTKSQILHRLCVAVLLRKKKIRFVPGELTDVFLDSMGRRKIAILQNGTEKTYLEADFVLERFSAPPSLPALLGKQAKETFDTLKKGVLEPDPTAAQLYPVGFLSDELMDAHYEQKYEVGIVYFSKADLLEKSQRILQRVGLSLSGSEFHEEQFFVGTRSITLTTEDKHKFRCYCPYVDDLPVKLSCLVLSTDSRALLESCLASEEQYHFIRYFTTESVTQYALDPAGVDTHMGVWILYYNEHWRGRHFEVQFWDKSNPGKGMYQSHELIRTPMLLEVLGNKWPTTKVHGLGHAVCTTQKELRRTVRGNELLQWDSWPAWWLPEKV